MTIRRRLYISNILMIVLPVVISLLVVGIIYSILMGAFGFTRDEYRDRSIDFLQNAQRVSGGWADDSTADEIEQSLITIAKDFPWTGGALYIYKDSQELFSLDTRVDQTLDADVFAKGGARSYIVDSAVVFMENEGAYTLVGVRENSLFKWILGVSSVWQVIMLALLVFGSMAAIILLVNVLLTRKIFRHIMQPLKTLVDGVRQIADGNLAYRIQYAGKDEFAPVIDDFNDMAMHLQTMVAAQQRDDESRRELIAGISHDLRTPLTSIIGYVEGLEKGVASTPAMQSRYLAVIHEQAYSLSHTINQLFLFTKLDTDHFPMHLERINLPEELHTYTETVFSAYIEKGLEVSLLPPVPPALWVQVDRVQWRNVLTNILENSVKYGNRDGTRMEIACTASGQDAIITLTDDGPGVADASLEKLFAVFFRGDTSRQNSKDGSGLGLAISARIIQRLGGAIAAENATPHGLVIRITLPLVKEDGIHAENIDR